MKEYVISDTHFGHANIIQYCHRPFRDVFEMDEALIRNWNNVVSSDDLVYHLGDFALYKDKSRIAEIVSRLNGRIVLIMGNHDTKPPRFYLDCGFKNATRKPILAHPDLILMHEPYEDLSFIAPNYFYLFGHVHDKHCPMDECPNCFCASVERIDYRPIELTEVYRDLRRKR